MNLDSLVWVSIDPEDFLKIKETLTRIGISGKNNTELYQSCHILHKRGKYAIVHFKELFLLDGKKSTYTDDDRKRRNTIAMLLEQWGLLKVVNPDIIEEKIPVKSIKIVPYKEKKNWELVPKYTIGSNKY